MYETRAMRRARRSVDRKERERLLKIVEESRLKGIPADGTKVEIPAEPGKIAWSIEWGQATLQWNTSLEEVDEYVSLADYAIPKSGNRREFGREMVLKLIKSGEHTRHQGSMAVATVVMWLAMTSNLRKDIQEADPAHIGFIIQDLPDGSKNFRLIAGGKRAPYEH